MAGDLQTTIRLVRDAKGGDSQAYSQLLARYLDRVVRLVRLRLSSTLREKMESMDVVQEVMARAIQGFDNFDVQHEKAFLHWLRVLVQNTVRDLYDYHNAGKRDLHLEAQKPRLTDSMTTSLIASLPADSIWNPSTQCRLREEVIELEAAMDCLDEEDREVIIMRQYEELTFPEISEITGIPNDTLRMRYVRAIDKLTDAMTKK